MGAVSSQKDQNKTKARSRISNGIARLPDVDGRSVWNRRLRDVMVLHLADIGGEDAASEAEKSIVRRVATLTVELEQMETRFAQAGGAEAEDLDLYQRTVGNLRRLLEAVGMKRRPKDVTPTLQGYIASKGAGA